MNDNVRRKIEDSLRGKSINEKIHAAIYCMPSEEAIEVFIHAPEWEVRAAFGKKWKWMKQEVYQKLLDDRDTRVRDAILNDLPGCPPLLLDLSYKYSDNPKVLAQVAKNPLCPESVRERLVNNECVEVRAAVAKQANTPSEIVMRLLFDENEIVRAGALLNPIMHEGILEEYANDPSEYIRKTILSNKNATVLLFKKMMNDPSENIRAEIAERIEDLKEYTLDMKEAFARDESALVRLKIASMKNAPLKYRTINGLVHDEDARVAAAAKILMDINVKRGQRMMNLPVR